jgi:hypothetical protein
MEREMSRERYRKNRADDMEIVAVKLDSAVQPLHTGGQFHPVNESVHDYIKELVYSSLGLTYRAILRHKPP